MIHLVGVAFTEREGPLRGGLGRVAIDSRIILEKWGQPVNLNTTKDRLREDPSAYALVDLLEKNEGEFQFANAAIYYNFPIYKENENVITAKLILVSRNHGVIVCATTNTGKGSYEADVTAADTELDVVFGQLHARLTRQRTLRRDKKTLLFNLEPIIYAPNLDGLKVESESGTAVLSNRTQLKDFLESHRIPQLPDEVIREVCAVIEGAKGLLVPRPRALSGFPEHSRAAQVNALEAEIRSFDQDQKNGYMEVLEGPQRIRGLAGSGKTVVLAMKAALTHLRDPEATIVYTFYTRSLYQHVRRLITRFYRQYDDQDPDWEKLQVMHAWGGRGRSGVYSKACIDHGVPSLTYSDVSSALSPFDAACSDLLSKAKIRPTYDYVFVDEGQDFPASFLRLCVFLAKDRRFVYAYDELQNIFQAEVPTTESVFGPDFRLDEDVVLHTCYRNPREILVCAHSLGFGIYSDHIVQMLENVEHWRDLGYEVRSGQLVEGERVDIKRPEKNSPSSISAKNSIDQLVSCVVYPTANAEISGVAVAIERDIRNEGLNPEDIVVLCTDDRYARLYFQELSRQLAKKSIATNNLSADSFAGEFFTKEKAVTLTSVHRAKGNEGYSVYVMGVDALFHRPTVRTRNMIFTAMTRAKAWLQITGVGDAARKFMAELDKAKKLSPHMIFRYPSELQLKVMKRDLSENAQQRLERALAEVIDDFSEDDVSQALAKLSATRKKKFEPRSKRLT